MLIIVLISIVIIFLIFTYLIPAILDSLDRDSLAHKILEFILVGFWVLVIIIYIAEAFSSVSCHCY